jgi:hypothetical protein
VYEAADLAALYEAAALYMEAAHQGPSHYVHYVLGPLCVLGLLCVLGSSVSNQNWVRFEICGSQRQ